MKSDGIVAYLCKGRLAIMHGAMQAPYDLILVAVCREIDSSLLILSISEKSFFFLLLCCDVAQIKDRINTIYARIYLIYILEIVFHIMAFSSLILTSFHFLGHLDKISG